jgi:hypothetical protein
MFFLPFLLNDRRIRIRIQEARKHVDPVDPDPDPQHCSFIYIFFNFLLLLTHRTTVVWL